MNYTTLKNSWGKKNKYSSIEYVHECYESPVTLSFPEWRNYIANGQNVLYASAIIPGGTNNIGWTGGSVYKGNVSKYGMYNNNG
jgi:hypothetical protein